MSKYIFIEEVENIEISFSYDALDLLIKN